MRLKNKKWSNTPLKVFVASGLGLVLAILLFIKSHNLPLTTEMMFFSAVTLLVFAGLGLLANKFIDNAIYTTEVENPVKVENLKEGTTYYLNGETAVIYLGNLFGKYNFQAFYENGESVVLPIPAKLAIVYISTQEE